MVLRRMMCVIGRLARTSEANTARRRPSRAGATVSRPHPRRAPLRQLLRREWVLVVVLALYAAVPLIVPVLAPVAIGDDWVYARSVEILLAEGQLRILDLSVVTLVWQVLWGGLFALVLGPSFGAMRLSSVVLTGIGGLACYYFCRQLDVGRGRSALGATLYLFNPVLFALSYTFMSDAPFVALLTIAAALYARGLRPDRPDGQFVIAGSFVAGLAFLERQQGVLIPPAVLTYLLLSRRLQANRAGATLFARVVALPATMIAVYYLWSRFVHGIPTSQGRFLRNIVEAGWGGLALLAGRLAVIEAAYVGAFVLPLSVAALVALPRLARAMSPRSWALFCLWEAFVVGGVGLFWSNGRRMPYIPHYAGPSGLGAYDLRGGRPWLIDLQMMSVLTIACAISALVLGLILCWRVWGTRKEAESRSIPGRAGVGLAGALLLWQVAGVLPQSFTFRNWTFRGLNAPSLDRYLLPLLPFILVLLLWALRDVQIATRVAWGCAAVLILCSVAGTRDMLVFHTAVWELAREANARGIPNTKLDAGAAWDGYHLYEYSRANNSTTKISAPWWIGLFAPASDATYIIAGRPRDDFSEDYVSVEHVEYSSWLDPRPVYLYLLRHRDAPWPP